MKKFLYASFVLCIGFSMSLFANGQPEKSTPQSNTLRFSFTSEPATLDPLSNANTADGRSILFNIYEGLVKPAPDGSFTCAVAQSYTISPDAKTYTFVLRKGIKFNDGSLVKPEDVKFTLDQAKAANFMSFNQIDSVSVEGQDIVIKLNRSNPEFLAYLTEGIVPADNKDREANRIGTGPYMVQAYQPQQSLTLVPNPYYWQKGVPHIAKVTFLFLADAQAEILGLQGGNVTGASLTGNTLEQLKASDFDIFGGPSGNPQIFALNNTYKPLADKRVRQALWYGINVQGIIDAAFYGRGKPAGSPVSPAMSLYYNQACDNPYPTDITKAKALLAQAGYADGFPLEITVPSNYTMHVDTAQVIVQQLAKIGVKASIKMVDWAAWLSNVYHKRNYQSTIISLSGSYLSPQTYLYRYCSTESKDFVNYKNPQYDKIYTQAITTVDQNQRIALYKQAQKLLVDDAASIFLQDIYSFQVFKKGCFTGVVNYPLPVVDVASLKQIK